jgi:hypothetical protein
VIELYHSCIDAILTLCLGLMPRLPSFLARKPLVVHLGVNSQNSEVLVRHDIIPVLEWELGMHVPLDELLSSIARARSRRGDGTSIIIFDKPAPDNLFAITTDGSTLVVIVS